MKATLIFNKNAGGTSQYRPEDLIAGLAEAGYEAVYRETASEEELDGVLSSLEGLVVAAGGDGTLRAVALRLVGQDIPLALLPLGTANNIGNAFGIRGKPQEIVRSLAHPRKRKFDIGRVTTPWGEEYFLEGMGYGFFADALALYDPEQDKSILRSVRTLAQTLNNYRTYDEGLILDGEKISGKYLMVEVLNTRSIGPRLHLAPGADPNDGFLDVVCVDSKEQVNFLRYVTGMLTERLDSVPGVRRFSVRKMTFMWTGFPFHIDDKFHFRKGDLVQQTGEGGMAFEPTDAEAEMVSVEVLPHSLELWLPDVKPEP